MAGTKYVGRRGTEDDRVARFAETGGAGSLLPTTGTGTATGDVTGELSGSRLEVTQGGEFMLVLEPSAPDGQAGAIKAIDGLGHTSFIGAYANSDDGYAFSIFADQPDGDYNVDIFGNSVDGSILIRGLKTYIRNIDDTVSIVVDGTTGVLTITHTATRHDFNGGVRLIDLAGNGTGVVAIDNDGDLSFSAGGGGMTKTKVIQLARAQYWTGAY